MTKDEKQEIINNYRKWFRQAFMAAHQRNTIKLTAITYFKVNPYLVFYLAKFFKGDTSPRSVAEVLLFPRILGTSVSTSFGQGMQKFISKIVGAYGSVTSGIDIEFIDQLDKRRKYCQLKSGPNSINKADVTSIDSDFKAIRNLARTNNLDLQYGDLVFGLLYGERSELNTFIKELETRNITVLVGKDFWHHFTGDPDFYDQLIAASAAEANDKNLTPFLEKVLDDLTREVKIKYAHYYKAIGEI